MTDIQSLVESVPAKNRFQEYRNKNRERINLQQRIWRSKNREKSKAHEMVAAAIKKGVLSKPSECERCRKEARLHGHHEDYSKPLCVIWLCNSCHAREHGFPPPSAPIKYLKGEANPASKLSRTQVAEIKSRLLLGESMCKMGREYGVSESLIRQIKKGEIWK